MASKCSTVETDRVPLLAVAALVLVLSTGTLPAQDADEYEPIGSDDCAMCHEETDHGTKFEDDLSHSIHEGLECLDCHVDRGTTPHAVTEDFAVGCEGCRACHEDASEEYRSHGRAEARSCDDVPQCTDCHGDHEILPSGVKLSKTHPMNIPATCGKCHEDIDLTTRYEILINHPIEIYQNSVHGQATKGGIYVAATCNDCHSTGGIGAPDPRHRAISSRRSTTSRSPRPAASATEAVAGRFLGGDPRKARQLERRDRRPGLHALPRRARHHLARRPGSRCPGPGWRQETCAPCHESAVLNEKYGRGPRGT